MVTAQELLPALELVGVRLDPWQVNLLRVHGLVVHLAVAAPDRSTPAWHRYQMRRLAGLWRAEARVLLRRGMDEVLDDATWAGLQAEAESLRRCADRLLEEVQ
jgi:hypothetical protein